VIYHDFLLSLQVSVTPNSENRKAICRESPHILTSIGAGAAYNRIDMEMGVLNYVSIDAEINGSGGSRRVAGGRRL
jgi:hypothetical protein